MLTDVQVIAPNLKKRLSGVTATLVRLLPLQAQSIKIVATGPLGLPDHIPHVPIWSVLLMPRNRQRVWHARRNTEMLLGLILRDILKKRLKLVFTSASQRHHTRYTRFLISRMDAIVATSHKSASYLRHPAQVITHGIDLRTFHPPVDQKIVRQNLNLPDALLIGCYGRIRHQKGTDVFVDAMIELCLCHNNIVALVMGRDTNQHQKFLDEQRRKVSDSGLSERILFLPEVPTQDMPDWYRALDIFVAPQRWEGFGLTPLEAMACGVPVVATTVGVFDELVEDEKTGLLVPPGDAERMAKAIDSMILNQTKLGCYSTRSRLRAESRFRIEDEASALNSLYLGLLDDSDSGQP